MTPGLQSALAPAGLDAQAIATLSWVMFIGAAAIFAMVAVLTWMAWHGSESRRRLISDHRFIVYGGIAVPVVVLTALLAWGLAITGSRSSAGEPHLRIDVTGLQWWWRVAYETPQGRVSSANELRLPRDRDVEITLRAADVIHSLWIPSLAGKVDMLPGIVNRLRVHATQTGIFRGQCAEYCGGAHAWMAFDVIVLESDAFDAWLAAQAQPAPAPGNAIEARGAEQFAAAGCGACHRVGGTAATGLIGPDLTHVGSRLSIAAGALPNEPAAFARWIRHSQQIKPGNAMPSFGIFSDDELAALGAYLDGLR